MKKMPVLKKRTLNESEPDINQKHRKRSYFNQDDFNKESQELARYLLGKCLVRQVDGILMKGKIVETESYPGGDDKASVTFNGKRTDRTEPLYLSPGTCWVYRTYGVYHCINISCKGDGAAIFIRAVEPLEGIEHMINNRFIFNKNKQAKKKPTEAELCNGPSKMCISLKIDTNLNKHDMALGEKLWIENCEDIPAKEIVDCPRIGIDSAGKYHASLPLRFYIQGNPHVSKIDKKREKELSFIS